MRPFAEWFIPEVAYDLFCVVSAPHAPLHRSRHGNYCGFQHLIYCIHVGRQWELQPPQRVLTLIAYVFAGHDSEPAARFLPIDGERWR